MNFYKKEKTFLAVLFLLCLWPLHLLSASEIIIAQPLKVIDRCGRGVLIDAGGTKVLLMAGSPYEMGYQHGKLLKNSVSELVKRVHLIVRTAEAANTKGFTGGTFETVLEKTKKFIDQRYIDEMQGLADGAGLNAVDVQLANIFPELFHCSGFALFGKATAGGQMLHGRILDYMTEVGLQAHAVVIVAKPDNFNAFVNVGYAGLIGSVTGMNDKQIAIGEMGGAGEGSWDGMPMTFLMRKALEEAGTLSETVKIFRDAPRTCEYYYVISDSKIPDARGLVCTSSRFDVIEPNHSYPHLQAVKDAVLMSGGDRYESLAAMVKQQLGKIDVAAALDLMNRPVAMKSCLHRVLFAPQQNVFWVSNASVNISEPNYSACFQPYYQYDFGRLLSLINEPNASGSQASAQTKEKSAPLNPPPTQAAEKTTGVVKAGEDKIISSPNPAEQKLLDNYKPDSNEFTFTMQQTSVNNFYSVHQVSFSSPLTTEIAANNTVYCEYYRCAGPNPRPAVIILDILNSSMVVSRLIANSFAFSGVDACIMTPPHYGQRKSSQPNEARRMEQSPDVFIQSAGQAVLDVRRTKRWLMTQPFINKEKIGICGTGLGGIVGSLAAGVDGRFTKAAFIQAGGNLSAIFTTDANEVKQLRAELEKKHISAEQLKKMLEPIEPLNFAGRLSNANVLMINASQDKIVPADCSQKLADAVGCKIIWYDTDHKGMVQYLPAILLKIADYFAPGKW
ncbi:MAG: C45 family autoproteolytic acyltransferase/hydrolase [Phycisphaerae bacterium]|jgi:dienelactone hydrolase/predicted choloylglycine hydrolase